jgi:hypothetical protein
MGEKMTYVGIKKCGCCVAATADVPEHKKETAKFLASLIRDELIIERKSVEWVRQNLKSCKCQTKIEEKE